MEYYYFLLDILSLSCFMGTHNLLHNPIKKYFPKFTESQVINLRTRMVSLISTSLILLGSYLYINRLISDIIYYYFMVCLKGYLYTDLIITTLNYNSFKGNYIQNAIHHVMLICILNHGKF